MSILEKIYAGFLGMNIGIRLGAPVEPAFWSYERIRQYYGDIRGYVKDYKHFAADDDANGPVFFLRALDDMPQLRAPTPQDVAEAWLNYAREGVGLYWWGGYGVSTEHTAYLNLKHGIPAPESGSIRQNGQTAAEQIGGQIFIDTWGLIAPGDPARAARYAVAAASVSHDGEGLYGAAFMAAAIAAAFTTGDPQAIIDAGLAQIPGDCLYRKVFDAVRAFHAARPDDWRACMDMLTREWGYDRYPGVCHIIPNAGVCALALCYGAGDFARTIEIATMCSWDTDCNAGNVGTILGVARGLEGIPAHYRDPVNDEIVLSGISGYLNILDLPTYARKLTHFAGCLAGETNPPPAPREGELHFDFALPGSTHGLVTDKPELLRLSHSDAHGGSLACFFERMTRGESARIGLRTFYRRRDFSDERYMPVFSPLAVPGQRMRMHVALERLSGDQMSLIPYARETYSGKEYQGTPIVLDGSCAETEVELTLPPVDGGVIEEIGVRLTSLSQVKLADRGTLYVTEFHLDGLGDYTLDLSQSVKEFGSVLPFSHNHGAWELQGGGMSCMSLDHAEAVTGNYFMRDVTVTGMVTPLSGESHLMGVRVQGAQRGVYAGLGTDEAGRRALVLGRTEHGQWRRLAAAPLDWAFDETYEITLRAQGQTVSAVCCGAQLSVTDAGFPPYGMTGYAHYAMGRTLFGDLHIKETGGDAHENQA